MGAKLPKQSDNQTHCPPLPGCLIIEARIMTGYHWCCCSIILCSKYKLESGFFAASQCSMCNCVKDAELFLVRDNARPGAWPLVNGHHQPMRGRGWGDWPIRGPGSHTCGEGWPFPPSDCWPVVMRSTSCEMSTTKDQQQHLQILRRIKGIMYKKELFYSFQSFVSNVVSRKMYIGNSHSLITPTYRPSRIRTCIGC